MAGISDQVNVNKIFIQTSPLRALKLNNKVALSASIDKQPC